MDKLSSPEEEDTDLEELKSDAVIAEKKSYYPRGKDLDGSPYSCFMVDPAFFEKAMSYYGNSDIVADIKVMRKKNPKADPTCGNWWLWAVLIRLGVARVLPSDDF